MPALTPLKNLGLMTRGMNGMAIDFCIIPQNTYCNPAPQFTTFISCNMEHLSTTYIQLWDELILDPKIGKHHVEPSVHSIIILP
jgi:hypothetical protein